MKSRIFLPTRSAAKGCPATRRLRVGVLPGIYGTLADWQTLAATPAHGTLHTRYSADGQLYLHASFQEGYFSVGVSSVPEDDLAGLA